ncbi:hypothetical protein CERZMDRAFT_102394 [Cercospora zeae-maydis SCOH1-5]|uniref:Uncharacterized protein n=1 Tax=Cercospora zeae-maydis SCOH1-5 TaxID=717836 RepID=A0A6A6EZ48_9PEZI|nr:hypothetical protein CERZMDRAFT_102394 [Cercospora zeae-maydis SCOH1-5]
MPASGGSTALQGTSKSANVQISRCLSHDRDANKKKSAPHDSRRYQIKREREEEIVVQICQLPGKYLPSSTGEYNKVGLEIAETCIILMLKTYSNTALSWDLVQKAAAKLSDNDLKPYIASTYTPRQLASALSIVAEKSFALAGWPMGGKKHMVGVEEGLSILTPTSGTLNYYEKMLWTATHIPTSPDVARRTIYRRQGKPVQQGETHSSGSVMTLWAKNPDDNFKGATFHGKVTMMMAFLQGKDVRDEKNRVPPSCWQYQVGHARILQLTRNPFTGVVQAKAMKPNGGVWTVTTNLSNSRAAVEGLGLELDRKFGAIDFSSTRRFIRDGSASSALKSSIAGKQWRVALRGEELLIIVV